MCQAGMTTPWRLLLRQHGCIGMITRATREHCDCLWLYRAAAAPGAGLGDMKPHKSRLEREKEAWTRQVSATPTMLPLNTDPAL